MRGTDISEDGLCLVSGGNSDFPSWGDVSRRRCSLPEGHDGQHIAYVAHNVTGNGADVYWLGPWSDARPYKGELTDRLAEEWADRDLVIPPGPTGGDPS